MCPEAGLRRWARSDQQQAPDKDGILKYERLSDIPAHREAKEVHFCQAECRDEVGCMPCHGVNGVRCFAGRAGNTRVVEEDYWAFCCKPVGNGGVPMIHPAPEMLRKD